MESVKKGGQVWRIGSWEEEKRVVGREKGNEKEVIDDNNVSLIPTNAIER